MVTVSLRLCWAAGLVLGLPGVALAQPYPPPSSYPPPPPQQTYPPPPPRSDYPPTQQGYPAPPQSYPPPPQSYPQGYPPPPQGYPPPQSYPQRYPAPPPASTAYGYQAPYELPYRAGQPVPSGYRLVEEPRYGLVTAGYLAAGIPYGIGLVVALSTDFDNGTEWLAVPFAGPWLTLGQRRYHCDESSSGNSDDAAGCLGDVFVVMGLVMDGLIQAAGGALLLTGYLSTKKTLIREDVAL
jgi:hypothetical protein